MQQNAIISILQSNITKSQYIINCIEILIILTIYQPLYLKINIIETTYGRKGKITTLQLSNLEYVQ
jgi:hypothetical protein